MALRLAAQAFTDDTFAIEIVGHASTSGAGAPNKTLSQQRANQAAQVFFAAVRADLVARGIPLPRAESNAWPVAKSHACSRRRHQPASRISGADGRRPCAQPESRDLRDGSGLKTHCGAACSSTRNRLSGSRTIATFVVAPPRPGRLTVVPPVETTAPPCRLSVSIAASTSRTCS